MFPRESAPATGKQHEARSTEPVSLSRWSRKARRAKRAPAEHPPMRDYSAHVLESAVGHARRRPASRNEERTRGEPIPTRNRTRRWSISERETRKGILRSYKRALGPSSSIKSEALVRCVLLLADCAIVLELPKLSDRLTLFVDLVRGLRKSQGSFAFFNGPAFSHRHLLHG